jgi:hypothetical protein
LLIVAAPLEKGKTGWPDLSSAAIINRFPPGIIHELVIL